MQYEVQGYVANGAVVTAINTEEYTGNDYSLSTADNKEFVDFLRQTLRAC